MFLPTYWTMASSIWASEAQAHGPIIIGVALYLLYRGVNLATALDLRARGAWVLLVLGGILYIVGRSQSIASWELGAQIPIFAACIALLSGWESVAKIKFPLFFLLFSLPLPAPVVDSLTGPLKILVSYIAEGVLATFGLPVARLGVILQIGQYQLLVADACSGLSSIFSLTALGLFYLYLVRQKKIWRRVALMAAVVPIAIIANVIRVITLMLITFFMGDGAGQGFLHGFAGMTLFLVALILLLAADNFLGWIERRRT